MNWVLGFGDDFVDLSGEIGFDATTNRGIKKCILYGML